MRSLRSMVIVNETAVPQHQMWPLPSPSLDRERDRKWNQKNHKLVDVYAALTLVYREGSEKSAQRSLPSGERSEPSRRVCEVRTVNGATFFLLYSPSLKGRGRGLGRMERAVKHAGAQPSRGIN